MLIKDIERFGGKNLAKFISDEGNSIKVEGAKIAFLRRCRVLANRCLTGFCQDHDL